VSTQSETEWSREGVLGELALAVNLHSEAVVLFHSAIAQSMGLDPTAYKTLFLLRRLGPLSAGEIARATGLATASVTDLIDRLVAKGYVSRGAHPTDRRRIVVALMAESVAAARPGFGVPNPSIETLFDRYDAQQLEVIADFLKRNALRLTEDLAHLDEQPRQRLEAAD
jgi:DNA-binding MarR family transcriptional regulator